MDGSVRNAGKTNATQRTLRMQEPVSVTAVDANAIFAGGVPGTVIITHGNSTHKAIFHAVRSAVVASTNDVSGLVAKAIAEHAENLKSGS